VCSSYAAQDGKHTRFGFLLFFTRLASESHDDAWWARGALLAPRHVAMRVAPSLRSRGQPARILTPGGGRRAEHTSDWILSSLHEAARGVRGAERKRSAERGATAGLSGRLIASNAG